MKKIIVTGAGGFIGSHLVAFLKKQTSWVRGIDIKYPEFSKSLADEFIIQDLRYPAYNLFEGFDEIYHLAADMGGIGYIETNKSEIVFNNTMIDMLTLKACQEQKIKKFLYTSSACIYPKYLQNTSNTIMLKESDAYPADSEDGYGWEKLMMEHTCRYFMENYGIKVHIARFHNIYGPMGTFDGGKEKSPAALCRKIAKAKDGDKIEIWGDGSQARSYCYIDDCIEALYALMQSDYHQPVNIGTDRLVSIDDLVLMIEQISKKHLLRHYDPTKPQGVMGRNADISLAKKVLGWSPRVSLDEGINQTYQWIHGQIYP